MNSSSNNHLKLPSKIHFIGIGGAGMNPLAGICLKNGVQVTGSDSTVNKNQDELRDLGADIWTPHSEEELKKRELPDICAYSTAIPPTNPEYLYLQKQGVEFWHRSDLLQKIANQFNKQIVISGTHGKTTTTAFLIWILEQTGLEPCWVLGGVLNRLGSYGWNTKRDVFVFEGDESDQSFLKSNPHIALVTSIEPDHLENYENSFDVQISKFQEFVDKSKISICHSSCLKHLETPKSDTIFYGSRSEDPNVNWTFKRDGKVIHSADGESNEVYEEALIIQSSPGKHNLQNALGAIAVANELGIDPYCTVGSYLEDFPGIYRRFELIGETERGVTVIDDYAHHPTEVKAAISAGKELIKQKNTGGKLIVLFQPHLPTRLRDQWNEFLTCFKEADCVFLSDLYVARGEPISGIDSKNLAEQIVHKNLTYVSGSPEDLVNPVIRIVEDNDLILILGAGDITYIRETLLENLRLKVSNPI